MSKYISSRRIYFSDTLSPVGPSPGEGRGPETPPSPDVRSGVDSFSGPRFVFERGSGAAGTVYNKLDYEVLDRARPAGHRIICRARIKDAETICRLLNAAESGW